MNFVLFHMGNELPQHFKYCVKQIRQTNSESRIYIITNLNILVKDPYIIIIDTKNLHIPDIGNYYMNDINPLWRTAVLRIFYIEAFLKQYELEHIIHFDNDVLIYENVQPLKDIFSQEDYYLTAHNNLHFVYGFSYIKNADSMKKINTELQKLVIQGEEKLTPLVGNGTMPNEMRLLKYINDNSNQKHIKLLPTLPFANNFFKFEYCFDPSVYGQVLGGATPSSTQDIGHEIIKKTIIPIFINNKPKVIYMGNEYKIFNLHIHNKQLSNFIENK